MTDGARPLTLTEHDRLILAQRTIRKGDRESLPDLWEPFRDVYLARVRPTVQTHQFLWRAFRFCAWMMLRTRLHLLGVHLGPSPPLAGG